MSDLKTLEGLIDDMNESDRLCVEAAAVTFQEVLDRYGEHGQIAFALIGARLAESDET